MSDNLAALIAQDQQDLANIPDDEKLIQLRDKVREWRAATLAKESAQVLVDQAQKLEQEYQKKIIPELMDHLQIEKFTVDGQEIAVNMFVHAVIAADSPTRNESMAWIQEHEPDLIRTELSVQFKVGEYAIAIDLKKQIDNYLKKLNHGPDHSTLVTDVHWKTLTGYVTKRAKNERLDGLPLDLLGATVGRVAQIINKKRRVK